MTLVAQKTSARLPLSSAQYPDFETVGTAESNFPAKGTSNSHPSALVMYYPVFERWTGTRGLGAWCRCYRCDLPAVVYKTEFAFGSHEVRQGLRYRRSSGAVHGDPKGNSYLPSTRPPTNRRTPAHSIVSNVRRYIKKMAPWPRMYQRCRTLSHAEPGKNSDNG